MKTDIEWVPVSDRLPDVVSENYLVVKNGYVYISLFRGDWSQFQCDIGEVEKVQYWAELPPMPSTNHSRNEYDLLTNH